MNVNGDISVAAITSNMMGRSCGDFNVKQRIRRRRIEAWFLLLIFVLLLLSNATTTASSTSDSSSTTESTTSKSTNNKCGIYFAPSTIPGSGMGMFAGHRSFDINDIVTFGDVIIPIVERKYHLKGLPKKKKQRQKKFLWDEYTWTGSYWDEFLEEEVEGFKAKDLKVASPGVGSIANSYLTLVNVEDTYINIDRAGLLPNSPGIGAYSLFYNRQFFATTYIPPGMEIFDDYGEGYFRFRTQTYGYIPLLDDFEPADKLIRQYMELKRNGKIDYYNNDRLWNDLWNNLILGNDNNDSDESSSSSIRSIWNESRILNALPENQSIFFSDDDDGDNDDNNHSMTTASKFWKLGGSAKQHYERSIRDLSWLEQHGQCMDNIKGGQKSQISPDAGRGAFANRAISKGSLVAPAPLIHIDINSLKMFQSIMDENDPTKIIPDPDGPITYQLLLNYCFGHDESTLLLCSYGLMTGYINHSHDNPNTKIVWSQNMRHPEWKQQNITEFESVYHAGLAFDYVAIRDIKEDEEILIDYGIQWETAWKKHVKNFVPYNLNYIPAYELNEKLILQEEGMDLLLDRIINNEIDGVKLYCREWYIKKYVNVNEDLPCQILKKVKQQLNDDDDERLLGGGIKENRYLVQLVEYYEQEDGTETEYWENEVLWSVPSDALYFLDMPYTRDHHMPNTFRHAMMIPDDIFPNLWKNKKKRKRRNTRWKNEEM